MRTRSRIPADSWLNLVVATAVRNYRPDNPYPSTHVKPADVNMRH